ncbi:hypothetical protein SUDANB176_06641 [Streptomyces sp. enrichment culture]
MTMMARIAEGIRAAGFRGCPFVNAAIEYAEPVHPVRQAVREHRAWFRRTLTIPRRCATT